MAEADQMIASAVVVPAGAEVEDTSLSTQEASHANGTESATKRRHSSVSSHGSKRPRLSIDPTAQASESVLKTNGSTAVSTPADAASEQNAAATRRKSRLEGERGRGKRLFGGLLSTLSQSSKPNSRGQRRADLERQEQEKLRQKREAEDEEQQRNLTTLTAERRVQQKRWDEESLRLRHANMRAMSRCLKTETEPAIYWRPYQLKVDEERVLDRQKDKTEEDIERETDEFWRRRAAADAVEEDNRAEESDAQMQGAPASEMAADPVSEQTRSGDIESSSATASVRETSEVKPAGETTTLEPPAEELRKDESDDGSDDHVVEAGEDSVIY